MIPTRPGFAFTYTHPAHFIALGFGAGVSRFAPGTVGTLIAFPLWWLIRPAYGPVETLAIVAYRQPVTRAEVEAIRGVNCDQTIYTLMQRRLIEERGRREAPGRPILYGTTWEFLECFGLSSLDDLPRALTPEGLVPADGARDAVGDSSA